MKTVRLFGMCGLLAAAAAGGTAAAPQDPKDPPAAKAPASTAQPGQEVPYTFRAYLVVDDRFPPKVAPPMTQDDRDPRDRTNKIHCLVCENALSPVVAVFVRAEAKKELGPTSGVGKLAAALNRIIPEYRPFRLAGFVMFLDVEGMPKGVTLADPAQTMVELDAEYPDDEKRDTYATDIRELANGVKASNVVFGLAPKTSKAATAWGIGPEDEVTVVIYNRLRVANRWKFKAADGPTDDQIKEIITATEEMVTGVKKAKE